MACLPGPPFTDETAIQTARLAEDVWRSRDPARVALSCLSIAQQDRKFYCRWRSDQTTTWV